MTPREREFMQNAKPWTELERLLSEPHRARKSEQVARARTSLVRGTGTKGETP